MLIQNVQNTATTPPIHRLRTVNRCCTIADNHARTRLAMRARVACCTKARVLARRSVARLTVTVVETKIFI